MNYYIVDEYQNVLAKTTTIHNAIMIAVAFSNEEENIHDHIIVAFLDADSLKYKGFAIDGKFFASKR